LITALDEEYISKEDFDEGKQHIDKTLALLNGYINYLSRAKKEILTGNQ